MSVLPCKVQRIYNNNKKKLWVVFVSFLFLGSFSSWGVILCFFSSWEIVPDWSGALVSDGVSVNVVKSDMKLEILSSGFCVLVFDGWVWVVSFLVDGLKFFGVWFLSFLKNYSGISGWGTLAGIIIGVIRFHLVVSSLDLYLIM